jgi:hypothetical protein
MGCVQVRQPFYPARLLTAAFPKRLGKRSVESMGHAG